MNLMDQNVLKQASSQKVFEAYFSENILLKKKMTNG